MLQIRNLHATAAEKPIRKVRAFLLTTLAASLLASCGDITGGNVSAADAGGLLTPERVAQLLPPEAGAVVTSYQRDLRAAAQAHLAQYGRLPDNLAELTTVAGARQVAVGTIADGLAQQVPFASRETLETAANGVVSAAERQLLGQMRTQDAPNP